MGDTIVLIETVFGIMLLIGFITKFLLDTETKLNSESYCNSCYRHGRRICLKCNYEEKC